MIRQQEIRVRVQDLAMAQETYPMTQETVVMIAKTSKVGVEDFRMLKMKEERELVRMISKMPSL